MNSILLLLQGLTTLIADYCWTESVVICQGITTLLIFTCVFELPESYGQLPTI